MARKQKTSPLEDLIEIIAMVPWWAGLSLAVVSYFVLHALAAPDLAKPADIKQIGDAVGRALWKGAAMVGQFVVPIACVCGAAV